jgi:predicted RNA-binding Zn-ribbon protein involved in translation (DUF1610 family)
MKLEFTCPVCSQHELEELRSAYIIIEIIDADILSDGNNGNDELDLFYGVERTEDRDIEEYRCETCGHTIATGKTELMNYLRGNKMLIED